MPNCHHYIVSKTEKTETTPSQIATHIHKIDGETENQKPHRARKPP